jgi:hypothetical protein
MDYYVHVFACRGATIGWFYGEIKVKAFEASLICGELSIKNQPQK